MGHGVTETEASGKKGETEQNGPYLHCEGKRKERRVFLCLFHNDECIGTCQSKE